MKNNAIEFEKIIDRVLAKMAADGYISNDLSNELRCVNASPNAKYHTTNALEMPKQPSAIIGNADHFAINVRGTWIHVS